MKMQRRQREGAIGDADADTDMEMVREKTARLRALRLLKEVGEKRAAAAKKPKSAK